MTDFINKVISMVLIVILCLIGPLNMSNQSRRTQQKLDVLNHVQVFLDTISDKGSVSTSDLDDLYRKLASTGLMLIVEVEEFRLLADGDSTVLARTCEITYERIAKSGGVYVIDAGNLVQVSFKEEVQSSEASMWYKLVGVEDIFSDQLAAIRR